MRCPDCDATDNRVVDTRASRGGRAVRRRRECIVCGGRFTTYEYVEERPIQVLKRSGNVEDFDRRKLLSSVRTACAKRPVSASSMDALVDDIEDALSRYAGLEVPSVKLGEMVMERLRHLDRVAYVRFASVYRNFQDAGEFQEFVDEMKERQEREALLRIQQEFPF
ncbi:MAG: transcriptional repressor NrdR [Gemmatimonadetes bacterium]|nr:transcriptional repressor NrdR [Gemmatimonadota bacterium]